MDSIKSNTGVFEDLKINVKLKLSALWVAVMFCYVYGDYIQLHVPGVLAKAMEINTDPSDIKTQGMLIAVAIFMAIPSIMVFLSLALKPTANRWSNIILGVLYILVMLGTMLTEPWAYYLFLGVIEIVLTMLIIWYAWKWPRLDAINESNE